MSPSFLDLGVASRAASDLAARGITDPFPIQVATLPDALAGRDVAGKAPTGSGKTLAFGLALVDRCGAGAPHRPSALVLVPTRELAGQVADELRLLARSHGLRVATVYGGVGFGPQRKALREAVDILVACPGRLMDLIQQGDVRLDNISVAVLDEADRMADMGFLPEVKRLLDQMPSDRQTLLFSATLDGDVDVIVRKYQRNPTRHELEGDDGKLPDATHLFWKTTRESRVDNCADVIRAAGATVVFCRTRHGAERVAKKLGKLGLDAVAIHGARSQNQREKALRDFTHGRAQALVATDVAARGIHVDDVSAVVHLDPPADHKDYVHRSGRTARAGAVGTVVSLVADSERGAVTKIQKALGLPTGTTEPDVSAIPRAQPRAATKPKLRTRQPEQHQPARRDGEARREEPATNGESKHGNKPKRDHQQRPAARDKSEQHDSQHGKHDRPNRAERRAAQFPDEQLVRTQSSPNQQERDNEDRRARDEQSTKRYNDERPAREGRSTLRRRQPEQHSPNRRDGEAHPDRAQRPKDANQQGMLRFFDPKKGFGFIIRPGAPDLFLHSSAIGSLDPNELTDGRHLSYRVEQGRKGDQATGVRLADRPRDRTSNRPGRPDRPSPRPGPSQRSRPRR